MKTEWIAVDWGMTQLRAWPLGPNGTVLDAGCSQAGVGTLSPGGFEAAILALTESWLAPDRQTNIVACGMVGAQQGWAEAQYVAIPASPAMAGKLTRAPAKDHRIAFWIVPGMKQIEPADVMRGEETQIAGFLSMRPDFNGVVCLPGTHTKWVRLRDGMVVNFQTFMTGELFALLVTKSVLRHSVAIGGGDEAAFLEMIDIAAKRPETIASRFFALRGEALIHGLGPKTAGSRLSGLLIGAELAAARHFWLGGDVTIIGAEALSNLYAKALSLLAANPVLLGAEEVTIAGLSAAYEDLQRRPNET